MGAWDDGRPDALTALDRMGKAYLGFARAEPAYYSAMFESGIAPDTKFRNSARQAITPSVSCVWLRKRSAPRRRRAIVRRR